VDQTIINWLLAEFGAALLVVVWAAYGVVGPVVFNGTRACHNALAVWMPAAGSNGNYLSAVRVQEVGEWRLSKLVAVLCAIPGLLMVSDPLSQCFAVLLPMLLADAFSRKIPGFDYAGHGAEIMAAEREGVVGYRAAEIERMKLYDGRPDMTAAEIDDELRRWHWLARIVFAMGTKS